ncbi:hypothetical protein SAMN02745127_01422 [Oceanospirillum multiglobuliferum]|uniref:DUF4142 domain-containing protein n=1 Tax=Oceanospirillum multiglobuliferum TaxID=64969 RepID=A0A1T4PC31_9GAMM|nr:hypothetical protein [Oceanospirillum multiglobuliferum]OPX55610.1 hypothetical protein BTE48_08330 [Oceanospirillum multiglobuliferum]SJZ89039.1 hypothetical protein SAMN02745127_01422 [Oceanospirillum multiglobuliferum]
MFLTKNRFKKTLLACTAAGLLLSGQVALAHSHHCKDTELSKLMEGMKDDLKGYVAAFKSSKTEEMQIRVQQLLDATIAAKDQIPLKLQEAQPMPNMKADEHSNMANMAGMSHGEHMEHMRYLEGIDKLNQLLADLQAAGTDSNKIKPLLGEIKQHSKSSHEAFRKECKHS